MDSLYLLLGMQPSCDITLEPIFDSWFLSFLFYSQNMHSVIHSLDSCMSHMKFNSVQFLHFHWGVSWCYNLLSFCFKLINLWCSTSINFKCYSSVWMLFKSRESQLVNLWCSTSIAVQVFLFFFSYVDLSRNEYPKIHISITMDVNHG